MGFADIIKPKSDDEIKDLQERGFRKDSSKWKFRIDISKLISNFEREENCVKFRDDIVVILRSKIEDLKILVQEREISRINEIISDFEFLDEKGKFTSDDLDEILLNLIKWSDDNDVWLNQIESMD